VVGDGDPALGDPRILGSTEPPMTVDALMARIASALHRSGLESVSEIVVDDRVFDRDWIHPSWPENQLNRWYCAEVAGLNFHTNCLTVYPTPASDGFSAPTVRIQPGADWIRVDPHRAKTITRGQNTAWITRPLTANEFSMRGNVRHANQEIDVTLHDVPSFFGMLLAQSLRDAGVSIDMAGASDERPYPLVRLARDDERFHDVPATTVVTTSIDDVLRRCNVHSQNLFAESLLKRIGHEVTGEKGSWENGGAVLRMLLTERLGPQAASSTVIADGSGMSRENQVSAGTLTDWLATIYADESIRDAFVDSLAVPGIGTLDDRFGYPRRPVEMYGQVHAKSGYLNG
ncbi:MAG: D-alanyl-D-alanine carboxypeptidase, partial [Phycisphaerales bacterium]|nr:D-alanyl-D-alanine carboxypeptidase [Phycisphaerales bacterium]